MCRLLQPRFANDVASIPQICVALQSRFLKLVATAWHFSPCVLAVSNRRSLCSTPTAIVETSLTHLRQVAYLFERLRGQICVVNLQADAIESPNRALESRHTCRVGKDFGMDTQLLSAR